MPKLSICSLADLCNLPTWPEPIGPVQAQESHSLPIAPKTVCSKGTYCAVAVFYLLKMLVTRRIATVDLILDGIFHLNGGNSLKL